MAAAEVKEVEGLLDRINRIYRIELEEAFDVGDDDWGAMSAEVGADPIGLGLACRNKSLCAAEAETLDRSNKRLLPAMIGTANRIVTALWHPMNIPAPKSGPPKTRHPGTMDPDIIGGAKLAD